MQNRIDHFYRVMSRPIVFPSRWLLGLLVIPLALSFTAPLWTMRFEAPQYPKGLGFEIYSYTVEGDIQEINTLNHYIGMTHLDRASLSDLDWLPFALGALILLSLRVSAIGDLRSLVDLVVLFSYFSVFSMARFAYQLYVYGHNLNPKAPITVDPFTPAIFGTKQVANFTTHSYPAGGTFWIGLFAMGLIGVLIWNATVLWRRESGRVVDA